MTTQFPCTRVCFAVFLFGVLCLGCDQQAKYDLLILEDRVEQLENELRTVKRQAGGAAERKALQRSIDRLQDDLVRMQQTMSSGSANFSKGNRGADSGIAGNATSVLPALPTRAEIDAAVAEFEQAGADVIKDDQGQVIELRATEFPIELETMQRLTNFKNLKTLSVSGPWVTHEMFDVFGKLESLERLNCEVTLADKKALQSIARLPKLKFIQLFRTDIDDAAMEVLAGINSLEQVRCGQTRIGDAGLEYLAGLENLRALDLSDCNRVSGVGVSYLQDLPRLKFLKVWGPQIDDAALAAIGKMKNMEVLGLNDTRITDEGFQELAGLKKLKELHLVRTRTGDATMKVLSSIKSIQTLRLRDTMITDAGLQLLSDLPGLKKLDVSENNSPGITDAGLAWVSKMENLEELNLWTTKVGDSGVQRLVNLPKLRWLNLDKTSISDSAGQALVQMKGLKWLHVGSNKITDQIIDSLMQLQDLKYLNISHTGISQDGFFQLDDEFAPRGGVVIQP